jgi:hypothetical protein
MMNQELIEHIKSQLGDLELDYQEGAWENFQGKEERKLKVIFWRRLLAAAVGLLFLGLFLPGALTNMVRNKKGIAHSTLISKQVQHDGPITPSILLPLKKYLKSASQTISKTKQSTNDSEFGEKKEHPITTTGSEVLIVPFSIHAELGDSVNPAPENVAKKRMTTAELLANDSYPSKKRAQPSTTIQKWSFGISFGQAMDTRSKTDFSIGTHVAYAINNKISLTSGLAYTQVGGEKKYELPEMSARTGKFQTGSQVDVSGLEMPIELQVKTGKQIYARLGLSAFVTMAQRQTVDYSEQKVVINNYVNENGVTQTKTITTTEVSTEPIADKMLTQRKMFGFYNLSLGYKQKVNKRNTIALEPYIKIPMSSYSDQQLNLVQGGLRIKVDF